LDYKAATASQAAQSVWLTTFPERHIWQVFKALDTISRQTGAFGDLTQHGGPLAAQAELGQLVGSNAAFWRDVAAAPAERADLAQRLANDPPAASAPSFPL